MRYIIGWLLLFGLLFVVGCTDCEEAQEAYCAAWLQAGAEGEAVAEATDELETACSFDENRSFFYAINENEVCLPDSLR